MQRSIARQPAPAALRTRRAQRSRAQAASRPMRWPGAVTGRLPAAGTLAAPMDGLGFIAYHHAVAFGT
jgi:hypothetical protein